MRKDLIPTQEEFNNMTKEQQIEVLCLVHECNDKIKKIHHDEYLDRWNPHPPQQFMKWWPDLGWLKTELTTGRPWKGLNPVVAFNCQAVREVYREGKETGTLWERPILPEDPDKDLSPAQHFARMKSLVARIGKPMPKISEADVALEELSPRTMPDP